jgi:FMN phosphatase YigB (HAD superfamily)
MGAGWLAGTAFSRQTWTKHRVKIRAVLFDVDGTLYTPYPLRAAMACELMLAHANPARLRQPNAIRILRAFRRFREELREYDGSVPVEHEQYLGVSRKLRCTEQDVRGAVSEWMYSRPLKYLPWVRRRGVVPLLDALQANGIRRGVFSDYPADRKLAALGLAERFDVVVSAVDPQIRAFKPSPRGFLTACERWELPPADVLYVGDRVDVDAAGATAAGMRYAIIGRRSGKTGSGWIVKDFEELQRVISACC